MGESGQIILDRYIDHCRSGSVHEDAKQIEVVHRLDALRDALDSQQAPQSSWFRFSRREKRPIQGLYLWGSVGRGKTFLMDLFFESLERKDKVRIHFYRFMQSVHQALAEYQGSPDPLKLVAKRFANEGKVLCFDEFFVSDITDAMLLSGLLHALQKEGVTLVATSNVPPSGLYQDGLQRGKFLPAISLLEQTNQIVNLDNEFDYRLRALGKAELYHYPLGVQAEARLDTLWQTLDSAIITDRLTRGPSETTIDINGRPIVARRISQQMIWFEFSDICGGPRSPSDYIAIAGEYATVFISSIPQFHRSTEDEARRFVSLIDEFYDRRVNLICTAQANILDLYQGDRLTFEFERTASRLQEMQSKEYFQEQHLS